jgi:hypothetical protein
VVTTEQPGVCVQVSLGSFSQSVGVPLQAAVQRQPCVVQVSASRLAQGVGVPLQDWLPQ